MLYPFLAIERWWLFDPNTLSSHTASAVEMMAVCAL
jgi:hypothetical protein